MSWPRAVAALLVLCACRAERPTEFVNVSFTISMDASDYRTWDFDEAACEDFGVPGLDDAALRRHLFEAVEERLEARGFERVPGGEVDFRLHYELWLEPEETRESTETRWRGSLVIRDAETGQFVWRATRRAPATPRTLGPGELRAGVRRFVDDLLVHSARIRAALDPR